MKSTLWKAGHSGLLALGLCLAWSSSVWSQSITATLPLSSHPAGVAVNRTTHEIYVTGGGGVTVVDGATRAIQTVPAGNSPDAVVVNEVTNKIYVANNGVYSCGFLRCSRPDPGSITVIDGVTNSSTTFVAPNAISPCSVAVNPSTNRIYVGNCVSHNVSVLDGADNSIVTTITDRHATYAPVAIAVNPTTNKIYVVYNDGAGGGYVTVIDGATNSTVTVTDPNAVGPNAVAVNTVTNRIYVTNGDSCSAPSGPGNVTIIDGDTNSTSTVVTDPNGCQPQAVAVNQTTNTIYVAHANDPTPSGQGMVTVIDGATNRTFTVFDPKAVHSGGGEVAAAIAVDEVTNTVYVATQIYPGGGNLGSISVIDGNSKTVKDLIDPKAREPVAVAVDPVSNQIYVANNSGNLTVIDGGGTATAHTLAIMLSLSPSVGASGLVLASGTVTSSPVGIDCGTTCTDTFAIGTAVKLVASAASGSYFNGWGGPCSGVGACNLVANEDQLVTAGFATAAAVPNVIGMMQTAASNAITGAGLATGQVTQQSSNTVTSGLVISESPAAGTSVTPGSSVKLVVSSGQSSSGGGGGLDLLTLCSLLGCLLFAVRRVLLVL